MQVHPALRGDPAGQQRAQQALETARDEWLGDPAIRPVIDQLAAFGAGAAIGKCPLLAQLIADHRRALAFIEPLVAAVLERLRDHPLGHVPLRHQVEEGLAVLRLAQAGRATLSLIVLEQRSGADRADTICFTDSQRYELCLAGSGAARCAQIVADRGDEAAFAERLVPLKPGIALCFPDHRHARGIARIDGRVALLRLARTPAAPLPTREFRWSDGALVHRASGDRQESRIELAMALLGRMGRIDAAPLLAEISRTGSNHLRWQALRECLALDSAAGFAALGRIASTPGDALAAPAERLRRDLLARYPALERCEAAPCPA